MTKKKKKKDLIKRFKTIMDQIKREIEGTDGEKSKPLVFECYNGVYAFVGSCNGGGGGGGGGGSHCFLLTRIDLIGP